MDQKKDDCVEILYLDRLLVIETKFYGSDSNQTVQLVVPVSLSITRIFNWLREASIKS